MPSPLFQPLNIQVPIVDPKTGAPTAQFQRMLQDLGLAAGLSIQNGQISIADNAVTMAKLADLASQRLIGRNSAGPGDPEAVTISQVLDWISNVRGTVLYRGAAGWAALAPGAVGQFLQTQGAGADPVWAAGGGGGGYEAAPTVPAVAGFTLQNAGTASMANQANGRGIVLTSPSAAVNIRFVRKNGAPPATPYTIKLRHSWVTPTNGAGIYKSSIILRNSTSGRIIIFGDYNSGNILAQRWSGYSAFNANVIAPVAIWPLAVLPWKRVINNGVTLTFGISQNGEDWSDFSTTEALATYINAAGGTVDEIGFGTMVDNPGFTNDILFNSFTAA